MQQFQQLFLEKFSNKIHQTFNDFCTKKNLEINTRIFLLYLIDKGILNKTDIRNFLIIEEFEELYPNNNFHKTQTIKLLAEKFAISDRAIWTVLNRKNAIPKN